MREGTGTAGRAQALSQGRGLDGGDQEDGKSCLQAGCLLEGRVPAGGQGAWRAGCLEGRMGGLRAAEGAVCWGGGSG